MVRFRVDEVTPETARLATRPLRDHAPDAVCLGDPDAAVIDPAGTHPVLGAVGVAFAQHRPLVLSPDAIWLTIAQGVAQHVRLHPELLRPRLVRHAGKKALTVTLNGPMPTDAESWRAAVSQFRDRLAAELGEGRARLFECDFSTSTEHDRIASQVVLLDAYAPYFSLWMQCVCGIPEITLTGTVDDWRAIRARIDVIAELELGFWCASLVPIADQFVRAASGDVDVRFWRRIYNPVDAYGGEMITGWITRLYPYLTANGQANHRNPMLALPIDEPRDLPRGDGFYSGPGIRSDAVPDTRSRVTVHVVDHVAGQQRTMALHGGVVGIAQDDDGALRPIAGWHLERATLQIGDVLDRLFEHAALVSHEGRAAEGPPELVALRHQFPAGTLFRGAWKIVTTSGWIRSPLRDTAVLPVFEVADGRTICGLANYMTGVTTWIACRIDDGKILDRVDAIPVFGTSLAEFLDGAIASGGAFDHMCVGTLQVERDQLS